MPQEVLEDVLQGGKQEKMREGTAKRLRDNGFGRWLGRFHCAHPTADVAPDRASKVERQVQLQPLRNACELDEAMVSVDLAADETPVVVAASVRLGR